MVKESSEAVSAKGGTWSRDVVQNPRTILNQDQYLCEGLWVFLLYSSKNGVRPAMNSPVTSYKHLQR